MSTRAYMEEQVRDPRHPWAPSPFKRLARTHALSVAGDAMFTTAMAGLVFLNVTDLNQARWRVGMALLFTVLPFSVAAPFIGPLIDRTAGGRKWMIFGLSVGRALVCLLLVWNRDNSWAMYPEFFLALVFAKGYVIAKGALVPTTVHSDAELVQANSKLSAISGIAAVCGGAPSLLVMWIASKFGGDHGPDMALLLASIVYVATAVQAAQLPSVRVADEPADEEEIVELHSAGIRHGAQAIGVMRGIVGFLTFMLAFHFKDLESVDSTASKVGLVLCVIAAQAGFMIGAGVAPALRKALAEERILMASLALTTVAALLTVFMSDLAGASLLALTVGLTSNGAKQAFDAIVQRDAPDANRGRAFARFETRFQIIWVVGALVATTIGASAMIGERTLTLGFSIKLGFFVIAIAAGISLLLYVIGLREAVAESKRRPAPLAGEPTLVEPQPASRSFLRRRPTAGTGEDDPTLVSVSPGDREVAPSGIDSTMVVAPATVAAAPMAAPPRGGQAPPPAGSVPWGTPGYAGYARLVDPADAPAHEAGAVAGESPGEATGLFGAPDAPIPSTLVETPSAGLFSLGDAHAVAPAEPVAPNGPGDPGTPAGEPRSDPVGAAPQAVFYDGSAWINEDDPSLDTPIVDERAVPPEDMPTVEAPPARATFVNADGSYPEPTWRDET